MFSEEQKEAMSNKAMSLVGTPFKSWGRDTDEGIDCYGLVIEFFDAGGVEIPDPTLGEEKVKDKFVQVDDKPQFGDVCHFSVEVDGMRHDHVGVVCGHKGSPLSIIHADEARGVSFARLRTFIRAFNMFGLKFYRLKSL